VIEVLTAGLLTTVQDRGRPGLRHLGVVHAGAADQAAHVLAQRLVGNDPEAAGLELTLLGPRLRFGAPAVIALTGGEVEARCAGRAVPGWRPVALPAGAVLELGRVTRGARAFLAVAGGLDVLQVMGSCSTDRRGGFGGLAGRALRPGDVLAEQAASASSAGKTPSPRRAAGQNAAVSAAPWSIHPLDALGDRALLRVLPGADLAAVAPASRAALFAATWSVGSDSDRMGVTLDGPALTLAVAPDRVSAPVLPGCLQLPAGGRPVLLGVDAQTVGGYPIVAHVIRADLDRAMQLRAGDEVRLTPVEPEAAAAAWHARQRALQERSAAIASRRRGA
jgi:antagonist of KipI